MAKTSEQVVPKWALLLFDTDGCTLATRTANLQSSDDDLIDIGQVRHFRHGKDVYLVEVLALADTKQELNEFERDWQVTERSEAIHSARSNEQVGNFLKIPDSMKDSTAVDINRISDVIGGIETRLETGDNVVADMQKEVGQLRDNQERILANQERLIQNQSTLMEAVLSIKELLSTRIKKARKQCLDITPIPFQQSHPVIQHVSETPVELSLPDINIPELMDFEIPQMLSTVATPCSSDQPLDGALGIAQTSPEATDLPAETTTIDSTCVRKLDFISMAPPSLNIGSVRNPVFIDKQRFEKAKTLPTAQRFILSMMDMLFTSDELASSSVMGGTMRYNGRDIMKKVLCKHKKNAIFHQAAFLYDKDPTVLQVDAGIRNAMNAKCRAAKKKI